ncbi:MAG: alpha/beta hydrolase [Flavobacterium sp.]|uniref:alpha/beta hydrolase family protein n=1 Tax=Flavobacterium sp. TaxID=239 RepID=UPI003263199C
MKKTILFIVTLATSIVFSQEISGSWYGALQVQGTQLPLVFNISKTGNIYASTMDSPNQKAFGIPVNTTSFENSTLKITIPNAMIEYEGVLGKDNIIVGNFKQRGTSFPMNLSKEKVEKQVVIRPQNPVKPYSYISEDITFENKKDGVTLAGTLTLPKKEGKFPVVILITGSGPQNRDEEILEHKPFLVISDYLTKNGIAVLRFDDRGIAESKGNFKTATTQDFANDVKAAVQYLQSRKEINPKHIGLMGHSEGGVIAPMVAKDNKDINFIILLAGTGVRGDKLMLLQKEEIERLAGVSEIEIEKGQKIIGGAYKIIIDSDINDEKLNEKITSYLSEQYKNENKPDELKTVTQYLTNAWFQFFIKFDPETSLEKVKCPVLALNGDKDIQVSAKINIEAIQKALAKGGNKKITTKILPNLNHLFQECNTGSVEEYSKIEQTFSPIALQEILSWIKIQIK